MQKVNTFLALIACVLAIGVMCLFFLLYAQRYGLALWNWIVFLAVLALGIHTMLKAIRKLG